MRGSAKKPIKAAGIIEMITLTENDLAELKTDARMVRIQFDRNINANTLKRVAGITKIEEGEETGVYNIYSNKDIDLRPEIFRYAVDKGLILLEMQQQKSTVEDVFQYLTKN